MKKYLTFGLILSLVSGACFAEHPRVAQLIAEKQQKMKKLEDCKGTTKALKIAGISTLGLTAVGVAGNIAEAVVLNNAKEDVNKAKKALKTEEDRQEKLQAEQDKRVEEKRKEEAAQKAAEQFAQEFAQTCKDAQGTQNDKICAVNDVDKNQLDKAHKMFSELLNMTCLGGDDSFECTKDDYKATGKVKAKVPAEVKKEESAPQPDASVKQPEAETKPEVQPEKTEPIKPAPTGEDEKAKIDAAFLTACTGKPTKGDAENSCTIHVADKTKTEDMDSVAVSKKLGDDVCPDNTVKKHDDKTKVFNCKTGTKPNRLYVKFDDIDDGDVKKGDGDNNPTNPEDKNVPVQETPQQPNEEPGKNTEQPEDKLQKDCPDDTKYDENTDACVRVQYIITDKVKGEKEEIGQLISSYLLRERNTCGRLEYEFAHDKVWKVKCEDSDLEFNFNLTGLYCDEGRTLSSSKGLCEGPITKTFKLGKYKWVDIWNLMYDKLPDNCKAGLGDYSYTPYKTQWIIKCTSTGTTYVFDFDGVICDDNETFDSANGECVAPENTKTVRVTGVGDNSFEKDVPIDTPADETVSIFSDVSTMSSNQAVALARMYMKFNHGHNDVCNPDKENENTIRCSNNLFPFASFKAKSSSVANEGIAKAVCEIHGRIFRDHVCQQATEMECVLGTSSVYSDIRAINPNMYVAYLPDQQNGGTCKITW